MEIQLLSLSSMFTNLLYILVAVLVLLVMITVHELGHYTAGRIFKFKINEFAIGFGKPIFKKVGKTGQVFSVRLVPLGGFCAFEGENAENTTSESFNSQKPWKRLIVLFAGAFFNFVFSIIIVLFTFTVFGQFMTTVGTVYDTESYSEFEGGFVDGDIIVSLNDYDIYLNDDIATATKGIVIGEIVNAEVIRNGTRQNIKVVYREYEYEFENEVYTATGFGIGISMTNYKFGFFESFGRSSVYIFKLLKATFLIPANLISGMVGIDQLGGPLTTIGMTAEVAQLGFRYLLEISAMLGISLAVFNLFPIPALDGSRMVFTVIEWIRKKPINQKVEGYIHAIGLILLFGMVITVDLIHLLY